MADPAGGEIEDTGYVGFFAADTTLASQYLRVKLSGDRTVTAAGVNDDDIGVCRNIVSTAGDPVTILLTNRQGLTPMVAAGAIAQNAKVYGAASGKITATASGRLIGFAVTAASGNNSVISVIRVEARGPFKVADPGTGAAIPVPNGDFQVDFTIGSAGAETNTLAIPLYAGQRCQMVVDTIGTGTRAVTVASAFNVGGNTIITFDAVRDYVELVGITVAGVLVWQNTDVATSAFS